MQDIDEEWRTVSSDRGTTVIYFGDHSQPGAYSKSPVDLLWNRLSMLSEVFWSMDGFAGTDLWKSLVPSSIPIEWKSERVMTDISMDELVMAFFLDGMVIHTLLSHLNRRIRIAPGTCLVQSKLLAYSTRQNIS